MSSHDTHPASGGASALFGPARERIASMRGQGREAGTGQATHGNTLAMKTGEHSTRVWNDAEVSAWVRERVEQLRGDVGPTAGHVKHSLLETFARLELIEAAMWDNLTQHGMLTGKGRTRAALSAFAATADRKARLAGLIGLDRVARKVPTVQDYMTGGADGR
jgi:hypothetical protein